MTLRRNFTRHFTDIWRQDGCVVSASVQYYLELHRQCNQHVRNLSLPPLVTTAITDLRRKRLRSVEPSPSLSREGGRSFVRSRERFTEESERWRRRGGRTGKRGRGRKAPHSFRRSRRKVPFACNFTSVCTENGSSLGAWFRECCWPLEAEVLSNSRNKIHRTTYKDVSRSLYSTL